MADCIMIKDLIIKIKTVKTDKLNCWPHYLYAVFFFDNK